MNTSDIHLRDPFVYAEGDVFYLYGTTGAECWRGAGSGFEVYTSRDLSDWTHAGRAFTPPTGFWGTENFWAPELHPYRGAYYLFASFKAPGRTRATAILRAESPLGPFRPWGAPRVTPPDWECLDGTLFVDANGVPWLVFCHEWVQIGDGAMCALRLSEDLTAPIGEPVTLFTASEAAWTVEVEHSSGVRGRVTDGPFLYMPARGELWLLWSSLSATGYAVGMAKSEDGTLTGGWRQTEKPIFSGDGGHCMLFRAGEHLLLALHAPNRNGEERPRFLAVTETEEGLRTLEG